MLSIVILSCYAECPYAECRYAECLSAECHYAECRYARCNFAECRGAPIKRLVCVISKSDLSSTTKFDQMYSRLLRIWSNLKLQLI